MPNRILRDGILSSEDVCSLKWPEEVFYRRLMSVADDHGRFHGTLKLLRSACYPLQIDKVSDSDIDKWLTSCVGAGLVRVYPAADGKRYLEILKFNQQVRSKSKYPEPTAEYLQAIASNEKQLPAGAHLGVGGFVFEGGSPPGQPAAAEAAGVVEIFEYWKTTMGHPRAALDDKRKKVIKARLKDYSPEDLKRAISGCKLSPYHMGKNENQTKYDSLELILRDAQHVDQFIAMHKNAALNGGNVPDVPPDDWWTSNSGVTAKGNELGLKESQFDNWVYFRAEVFKQAGHGPWSRQ